MRARPWFRRADCVGFAIACALLSASSALGQDAKESPARAQIQQIIQQFHADASVAFRSLDGTQELFIKAAQPFPAAPSVIQIPVMIELYAQAQSGSVNLTDTILVHNNFTSLIDGKPFHLESKTDPDRDLYLQGGKPVSLQDLCDRMVTRNSTLAADLLIEKLGADRVRQRMDMLGVEGFDLLQGVEPPNPNDKQPHNAASARVVLELLWSLAKRQEDGDDAGKEMIGLLARAALHQPPTAGMPSDPRAAQALQLLGAGQQSMIVYGPHPFVVVVLARGITNPETSAELMALIQHALAAGLATTS